MKKLFFTAFSLIAWLCSFGQESNIREEILNYRDISREIIEKGRQMLSDKLKEDDLPKTKEIKDFLIQDTGDPLQVFYPMEYILLLYWTEDYDELITFINDPNSQTGTTYNVLQIIRMDNLFRELYRKSNANKDLLIINIETSDLSDEDRDFLKLHLNFILVKAKETGTNAAIREAINEQADAFFSAYPASRYRMFIRKEIRPIYRKSNWGGGFDIGFTKSFPRGNLSSQFNTGMGINMSCNVQYKRSFIMLDMGIRSHKLRRDMDINNTTWASGSTGNITGLFLSGGVTMTPKKQLMVYPYAGIGYMGIEALEKDYEQQPELEKLGLNAFAYCFGIGVDYSFDLSSRTGFYYGYSFPLLYRVGLRYTYQKPLFRPAKQIDGFSHAVTLSYGLGNNRNRKKSRSGQ